MARPLTEPLLRALIGEARIEGNGVRALAIEATPTWEGDPVVSLDVGSARIVPCVSSLAVREALLSHTGDELLVVLTDREEKELGDEVLARLWRNRVHRPSGWQAVQHLFRVDQMDPELADHRWLVDLLVEVAPPRGYPPPPSGFLDVGTAWRTYLRHGLRLERDRPSVADLLRWGQTEGARSALSSLSGEQHGNIASRLAEEVGPSASHMLRLVAESRGADLVPFGLVCDVLWADGLPSDPTVVAARARFETPLGARDLTEPGARSWGHAAVSSVRLATETGEEAVAAAWTTRAEHLLGQLEARGLAIFSDVLPSAFTQRLEDVGRHLTAFLDQPKSESLTSLEEAAERVGRHQRSRAEPSRVRSVQMAVRLARRATQEPYLTTNDLAARSHGFIRDGAWVDAAREPLEGETVAAVGQALGRLTQTVDTERAERDRGFAAALVEWSRVLPTSSTDLLPIERMLDEIVVPVARLAPVLLLVVDGLSHPEAIRILDDVFGLGWTRQGPNGNELPLVVAAIPTVTNVSRASLLCGKLTVGDQAVERVGFADHPGLRDAAGGQTPKLFHKRDLGVDQGHIAPEVRDVILGTETRVVGVVVNGVDDHLAKGGQLRLADGLEGIKPLRWLLDTAAEAGRVVVLTSDHGHVLERGSHVRAFPGGGERWRLHDLEPGLDEVLIAGPRVMRGEGRIVAPAVESIRYNATEKRGYHGGATPQEALCPLVVLVPASVTLDGWQAIPAGVPLWWDPRYSIPVLPDVTVVAPVPAEGQQALFRESDAAMAGPTAEEIREWIGALVTSTVLAEQRELAGRGALDDADLIRFLRLLEAAGGVLPAAALARALELPMPRLRTKLEALRRMLNVEGYAVLSIEDDGTARLNLGLLAAQFGVDVS